MKLLSFLDHYQNDNASTFQVTFFYLEPLVFSAYYNTHQTIRRQDMLYNLYIIISFKFNINNCGLEFQAHHKNDI